MDDVEIAWDYFKKTFLAIIDKHAPFRRYRVRGRDNPWFNDCIATAIRERNEAWVKAKKHNSDACWLNYRVLRNKCTRLIKSTKNEHYLNLMKENLNDPKKFWKAIKSSSGDVPPPTIPEYIATSQGEIRDKQHMVDTFNMHFINAGIATQSTLPANFSKGTTTVPDPNMSLNRPTFNFSSISAYEVQRALQGLDCKKSAGPDQIEPYFLRTAANLIADPIASIFNLSLYSGSIPTSWKSAFVLPLLKSGDPSLLDNYRPISRLSVLAKLFESLINEQLKYFLTENSILNPMQSGFRQGHSTVTAVTAVTNDILNALDNKKSCAAIFIDLSKAFDTVDHDLLLKRLQRIGFSDTVLRWFSNYLSDRTQCIVIDNYTSTSLEVTMGVPQGSVLGPILFSLYLNDLGRDLKAAKVHLYADDTILYTTASSVNAAFTQLQSAFNHVQTFLIELKLVLNAKKTKTMSFTQSRSSPNINVSTLDGTEIEGVSSYKYLGIWLDDKMSLGVHIESLCKKLRPKLGFFFRMRKCFPYLARRRLVQSTFLSVLDYGDTLYMHSSLFLLKKLDVLYHSALRFITGASARTHHCTLYETVQWSSLSIRRKIHALTFIAKALMGKLPLYIFNLLSFQDSTYRTRSSEKILLRTPFTRTELGKTAFSSFAPKAWNELQATVNLKVLPSINSFKDLLKSSLTDRCNCF